jgi:hypothetical protein
MESILKISKALVKIRKRDLAPAVTLALALLVASSGIWGTSVSRAASNTTTQPGSGQQSNPQSPNSPQHYQDVPPSSPFYDFVQNIADAGIVAGYQCGTPPAGVCVPPGNLPYYLPGNNVSRGQMAKFEDNGRNLPGINMDGGTMLSPWIIFSQASGGSNITSITNANNQRSFYAIANASNSTLIGATNLAGSHDIGFEGQLYGSNSIGVQAIVTGSETIGVSTVTTGSQSSGVQAVSYGDNALAVGAYQYGTGSRALIAYTYGGNSTAMQANSEGNNSTAMEAQADGNDSVAVEARAFGTTSYGLSATSNAYRAGYFHSTDPNTNWASLLVDPGHGGKAAQFNGDVNITGTLTVGSCVGCFGPTGVMQNVGDLPIEAGDVVQVVGTSRAVVGAAPVLQVRKSDAAYQGTVVGVAGQALYVPSADTRAAYEQQQAAIQDAQNRRYAIMSGPGSDEQKAAELAKITVPNPTIDDTTGTVHMDTGATKVNTNSYGTLATDGTVPAVKVTAANGPIHVGDLLVTSDSPGVAMKADLSKAITGTVIGKALGNLERGTGTMPVLITLK